MPSPTVIRHTELNKRIHQVITYWDAGDFLAVYQAYDVCKDRTVMHDSQIYSSEEGAISAYLMQVV